MVEEDQNSNPKSASVRIGSMTAQKMAGQLRHDLRRGLQPDYVDASRIKLNRVLLEPSTTGELRNICEERRALRQCQRKMKSNAAIGTRGIITFGSEAAQMFEAIGSSQQDRAFRALTKAIARHLNTTVHGLVVHNDEATIHAHFILAAFNMNGDPLSKSTSPKVLSALQDIAYDVLSTFCPDMERGRRYGDRIAAGADYADTVHKSVKELHRTLPADLAKKRGELKTLELAEQEAEKRVQEMQTRVSKLHDKAKLSDAEVKRLATYEKRLKDRVQALNTAQAKAEAARAEATRLAEIAKAEQIEEETKSKAAKEEAEMLTTAVTALAEEVNGRSIRRTKDGKLTASHPERLKPAAKAISPAILAAADLVGKLETEEAELREERAKLALREQEVRKREALIEEQVKKNKKDRDDLQAERAKVETLKNKHLKMIGRMVTFLGRDDLTQEAWLEGKALEQEARELSAEDPPEEFGHRPL
nr:plasmid recombination protein [Donghicola mangrovi]